jgi:bifunctional DNA-binding transcriptional regulator/antitoxin component of YhaV-PrlF toxin-antitoxin module
MWPRPCGASSASTGSSLSQRRSAIDILHLIDRLEELIGEGMKLPIGGRVAIDRRRLLDLIDQMRVAVPAELREAQEIVSQRDEVLAKAREESQLLLARAQQEVEERLGEEELVKAAQTRGDEMLQRAEEEAESLLKEAEERVRTRLGQAETVAAQQMDEADRYALEMLKKLESQLSAFLGSVRAGVESMESKAQPRP